MYKNLELCVLLHLVYLLGKSLRSMANSTVPNDLFIGFFIRLPIRYITTCSDFNYQCQATLKCEYVLRYNEILP